MSAIDFSLKNTIISDYFIGKTDDPPIAEFTYIHAHPLIQPNFVSEIELLINETAEYMVQKNMVGKPVNKLFTLAENLGKQLPMDHEDKASEALILLREIYQFCNKLTGKQ